MPFFAIPFSVKVALFMGAAVGAGFAVLNNQQVILETAEAFCNAGSKLCRQKLEAAKVRAAGVRYADQFEDGQLADAGKGEARATGSNVRDDDSSSDSVSTPDTTDFSELDTSEFSELDTDYEREDDEDSEDEKHSNVSDFHKVSSLD
ncbi:uncharacterized protein LODBEIA_P35340 [Lodderomyces beijingensis]|uniref:Uncharacterized protein n=1 Tax=Lodderomyces beijingensis TaxID=1775926 RepID=A0ABP0ZMC8_9ASCO